MMYTLRTIVGVLLILLAIITGPIPVVQGWVFFLAALAVLGPDHPITKYSWAVIKRGREKLNEWGIWRKKDIPPNGPPVA